MGPLPDWGVVGPVGSLQLLPARPITGGPFLAPPSLTPMEHRTGPRNRRGPLKIESPSERGVAQLGSAGALGALGRRFESCRPDSVIARVLRDPATP